MSWNFSYSAKDKEEARKLLDEKIEQSGGHCPDAVADIVANAIDAIPDMDSADIGVASYGHFNSGDYPGTSNLSVTVSQSMRQPK